MAARLSRPGTGGQPEGRRLTPVVLPTRLGQGLLVSERAREAMVRRLASQGIADEGVLAAMRKVPRHAFIDEALASRAYEDTALPIGARQTISQPWVVARCAELMRQRLGLRAGLRVLEVGTGCGYQAAVLAGLFGEVVSIERIRSLHEQAGRRLGPLQISNLQLLYGDGMQALPETRPFDGIVTAAAAPEIPPALLAQLAPGGVLVMPVGDTQQRLWVVTRTQGGVFERSQADPVRFVPLLPGIE